MVKLHTLLSKSADETIVSYQQQKVFRWQQLRQQIDCWRAILNNQSAKQIVLYQPDSFLFTAALLAIWHSGKTAIIPGNNLPSTLTQVSRICSIGIGEFPADAPIQTLLPSMDGASLEISELTTDLPALTIFTSGSSGEPKPVNKRIDQLQSEIQHLEQLWGTQAAGCRIAANISHQHIYGLLFKVLWPLCSGRPFINQQLSYPEEVFACLNRDNTVLLSSPAHLKRLPESLAWQSLTQPPALVFSSGGPLSQNDSLRAAALLGTPISEVYGSSETGGIAQRRQQPAEINAPWQVLPGVEIKQAKNGTLMVRSAHLESDQWYTSADRITLLENGRFQLAGRIDRIAKVEGKRISLEKIEELLNQHPWITESKVLALSNEREQLAAVVALNPQGHQQLAQGKRALNQQFRELLCQHIERIAIPRKWRYLEQLPYNSQGKVTQASLLALFETDQ